MTRLLFLTAAFLFLATGAAHAHVDPVAHGSFASGFTHPIFGWDHVLAMVAVGLWATQLGRRGLVVVPTTFVATMVFGFALALAGAALPLVEPVILASVIALGLLVAFALRLSPALGAVVVAGFALFHGFAHGAEMGAAGAAAYGAGFAVATALLHGVGIGLVVGFEALRRRHAAMPVWSTRAMGAATACGGVVLSLG